VGWLTKLLRSDSPPHGQPRYPLISAGWCCALVLLATVIAIGWFYAVLYERGAAQTTYLSMLMISVVFPWLGAIVGVRFRRPMLGVLAGAVASIGLCMLLLRLHNTY
jgi:hypothetical protein